MKPAEIKIKIAEACGWKWHYGDATKKMDGLRYWRLVEWKWPQNASTFCELPDYTNDLNAMHDAEKMLVFEPKNFSDGFSSHAEKWSDYNMKLAEVVAEDLGGLKGHFLNAMSLMTHATAAQRAEAFLRAMGLWEE